MQLYDPDRHVHIAAAPWSESAARTAIQTIVADAADAFDPDRLWPKHPDEHYLGPEPERSLYCGAAGVVWALAELAERGYGTPPSGCEAALARARDEELALLSRRAAPAKSWEALGLLLGDAGFCVALYKLTGDATHQDRAYALVEATLESPICEYMSGSPGLLAMAIAYAELTRDERWLAVYRRGVRILDDQLDRDDTLGGRLWRQQLGGREQIYYGAVHGFAGNAFAVVRGLAHLGSGDRELWCRRARETTLRLALRDAGRASFWAEVGEVRAPRRPPLVHHCHGSPGMITGLGALIDGTDPEFDRVLLDAGELTYEAGPLVKGAGLCHGTSGNGFALLRLYARTRDTRWLDRAREMAMAAIEQVERRRVEVGRGCYSLWTGDVGTALFLDACRSGDAAFPTMDRF